MLDKIMRKISIWLFRKSFGLSNNKKLNEERKKK